MDSVNNLCRQYEEKVRPCIDLIDSLRALGVEQDLALPAITVIGDQSSGKSSVLEALSGVALPRGNGIVTMCPLVLKLKQLKHGEKWRGKVIYKDMEINISNPSIVESEINKAQNLIAGKGSQISSELISLEVSSPHVPDLTLIDLPGIIRLVIDDQPKDIEHKIKKLIRTYIQKQETINLVVVPSNVDIATTEALSMAREVDPDGDRTIGILTKPDLVDRGAEDKVVEVVQNLVYPLKKGYMIVKCRSQQDIQEELSLTKALQDEQVFFKEHPYFSILLEDGKATVPCLAERLTEELTSHICMVQTAFVKVLSNDFGDFLNLYCTAKSKIKEIRVNQEKKAEKLIRLHFKIEQIVYCQDQVYKETLKRIREKEAEKEKTRMFNPATFQNNSQFPQEELTTTEMTQHLKAYYQECRRNIGRQIPLIIQYLILNTFGEEIEKMMLQLLQDTNKCSWFLEEQSDTREKKKFLKRRLLRLNEARQKLAKFSD